MQTNKQQKKRRYFLFFIKFIISKHNNNLSLYNGIKDFDISRVALTGKTKNKTKNISFRIQKKSIDNKDKFIADRIGE